MAETMFELGVAREFDESFGVRRQEKANAEPFKRDHADGGKIYFVKVFRRNPSNGFEKVTRFGSFARVVIRVREFLTELRNPIFAIVNEGGHLTKRRESSSQRRAAQIHG